MYVIRIYVYRLANPTVKESTYEEFYRSLARKYRVSPKLRMIREAIEFLACCT